MMLCCISENDIRSYFDLFMRKREVLCYILWGVLYLLLIQRWVVPKLCFQCIHSLENDCLLGKEVFLVYSMWQSSFVRPELLLFEKWNETYSLFPLAQVSPRKLCQESINVAWLNFSIKESIVRKLYFLCYSLKMSRETHIHCTCIYLFSFTIHKDLLWDYIKIIYCLKMSKKIFILFTIQNDLLRLILFHTYV